MIWWAYWREGPRGSVTLSPPPHWTHRCRCSSIFCMLTDLLPPGLIDDFALQFSWIHTSFHHFTEISQIFHDKYIFNDRKNFPSWTQEVKKSVDLQGFIGREWNWPTFCLNDSKSRKRDFKGSLKHFLREHAPRSPRSLHLWPSFRKSVSI